MELWIRSQNKKILLKVDMLCLSENGLSIHAKPDFINNIDIELGTYKTKERALEVLDEIQNFIKPKFLCDGIETTVETYYCEYHLHFKEPNIFNERVYQMPKE